MTKVQVVQRRIPESVDLKLDHAKQHLNALDVLIGTYTEHPVVLDHNVEEGGRVHTYRVASLVTPPSEVSLAMGDVIHDARSCLDHLAFALVDQEHLSQEEQRRIAFPIEKSGKKFKSRAERCLPGVDGALRGVFENCQPYQDTSGGTFSALSDLQRLSNVDKHRSLNVVTTMPDYVAFSYPPGVPEPTQELIRWGQPFAEGTLVARIEFKVPHAVGEIEFGAQYMLVLDEPRVSRADNVLNVLGKIVSAIEYEVLPLFREHLGL